MRPPAKWRIRRLRKGFWQIQIWGQWGPYSSYVTKSVAMSGQKAIEVFAAGGY